MKLWPLSDLHLEFDDISHRFRVPDGVDVCVCTGDLVNKSPALGIEWLAEHVNVPTIYVAGNHEYYRGSLVDGLAEAREAAKKYPNIHFLENDVVVIDGVRFIGATLWTDFKLMGDQGLGMMAAQGSMNDFKAIKYRKEPYARLMPKHLLDIHIQSRAFIEQALATPFEGKTVLVTHHGVHPLSVHRQYAGDSLNSAFVSNLDDLIYEYRPHLCLHGHVHNSFNYQVHDTHIVVNPRGYVNENKEYQFDLIIDLDDPRYQFQGGKR